MINPSTKYTALNRDVMWQNFLKVLFSYCQVGSNLISDIRINKLGDDVLSLMDMQSDSGTSILEEKAKQILNAWSTYEYSIGEKLDIQVGDYKLEYLPQKQEQLQKINVKLEVQRNGIKNELDLDEPADNNGMIKDLDFLEPTQIIPAKSNNNNAFNRRPVPVFAERKDNFSFGDATQIIEPIQKKNDQFLMPAPRQQQKQNLNQDVDDLFDGATQLIAENNIGGNNNNQNQANEDNFDMFGETQVINHKPHQIVKKMPQQNNPDILNDATQIIDNLQMNKRPFKNPQVPKFDMNNDATQIIQNIPKKDKVDQQNNKKPQVNPFDLLDATLIIPEARKKPFQQGNMIEPTLIINQGQNQRQNKVEESDIDKLLDIEPDESPKFGINGNNKKENGNSISSSVDDIFDALDNKKNMNQGISQKNELAKIVEKEEEYQEDNIQLNKQDKKFKQSNAPKINNNKKKQSDKNEADNSVDDSLDDILEERKNEPALQQQQSQRYNKKRKLNEISNDSQLQSQQNIKKSKLNEELVNSQEQVKNVRLRGKVNQASQKVEEEIKQQHQMVILVSGKAKEKEFQEIIKKLGGKVIDDIAEQFDVMVTDGKLIRNCKLLQAINLGAKIVNTNWLTESQKKKQFVEIIDKFIIIDKEFEKQHNCKLQQLYNNKQVGQLLQNHSIYVSKNIQGLKQEQMQLLVESAGGKVLQNEKEKNQATICIMDQNEDKNAINQLKKNKKIQIQSIHFILDGIIQQNLDFKKNSLA
ncbi:UNKNOWN [Stylonychia lemnae]|uniref:BRCT domain-containing protein n=1 Tax=Stylonychia lemnae TaxID=5949 RepID=A0A077ZYE0_STYLE|nr:UNKNOWN [Stylonychia lemnae]|eukprot:CDW74642.1 UNKNOWN [Stylonychia lemnae]